MSAQGEQGSIVTILCDGGERYGCTYYDDDWLSARGVDWQTHASAIDGFLFGQGD